MAFDPVEFRQAIISRFRPWMAGVAAVVVAVGVGGWALLGGSSPHAHDTSGQIQVEVVAPVEPDIQPGSTMEVGHLVNGYTHVAIEAPGDGPEKDAYVADYETPWVEPSPEPPVRRRGYSKPAPEDRSESPEYGKDDGGQVEPDYAAERRARRDRADREGLFY